MKFASRFKMLREERGLSAKELGENIGVSDRMVRYYEAGEKRPDIAALARIADYFGVSTDFLIGRSDER